LQALPSSAGDFPRIAKLHEDEAGTRSVQIRYDREILPRVSG
jgi:hypothetical protein